MYGFNPDNLSSDPGAYDVFNGALGEFDAALNVGLYAAERNGGALVPTTDIGTDLHLSAGPLPMRWTPAPSREPPPPSSRPA